MSSPIEDYALIGDGQTAALVNRNGSIDWLCWPRFDSDACFCALLGAPENGRWQIAPKTAVHAIQRRYEDDTLVLETDTTTDTGASPRDRFHANARGRPVGRGADRYWLVGFSGDAHASCVCVSTTALVPPWCEQTAEGLTATIGPDRVTFSSPVQVHRDGRQRAVADFVVAEGPAQTLRAELRAFGSAGRRAGLDAERALGETRMLLAQMDRRVRRQPDQVAGHRQAIADHATRHGPCADGRPGGGADNAVLPEIPGGRLNWDYRYCWLRDSTFTLGALANAGFKHEAEAWRDWLLRAIAGAP